MFIGVSFIILPNRSGNGLGSSSWEITATAAKTTRESIVMVNFLMAPTLISHSRGVHFLLLLLLEVADAVDGGERGTGVVHPDAHGVVLIGDGGTGVGVAVEDVVGFGYDAPLAVVGGPAQRGVQIEQRTDVVNALDGFRLEERIEDELDIMPLGQFGDSRAAEDGREAGAVEGQVEEVAALVVTVEARGIDGTVENCAKAKRVYLWFSCHMRFTSYFDMGFRSGLPHISL